MCGATLDKTELMTLTRKLLMYQENMGFDTFLLVIAAESKDFGECVRNEIMIFGRGYSMIANSAFLLRRLLPDLPQANTLFAGCYYQYHKIESIAARENSDKIAQRS